MTDYKTTFPMLSLSLPQAPVVDQIRGWLDPEQLQVSQTWVAERPHSASARTSLTVITNRRKSLTTDDGLAVWAYGIMNDFATPKAWEPHKRVVDDYLPKLEDDGKQMLLIHLAQTSREFKRKVNAGDTMPTLDKLSDALVSLLAHYDADFAAEVRASLDIFAAKDTPAKRWAPWVDHNFPGGCRWVRWLVETIWKKKVQRWWVQVLEPGITRAAQGTLFAAFSRATVDRERMRYIPRRGEEIDLVLPEKVAALPADLAFKQLSTLTTQRLVRHLITTAAKQRFVERIQDPNDVKVIGGFRQSAKDIGLGDSRAAAVKLHKACEALACLYVSNQYGKGHVYSYHERAGGRGRKKELVHSVSFLFDPGYINELIKRGAPYKDQRLIPIPVKFPALVGHMRNWGSQATLQIRLLMELRDHADELVREGSVWIPRQRWIELADEAEVPTLTTTIDDIIAAWLKADPAAKKDRPAFLLCPEPERYTLAKPYAAELNMLLDGGSRTTKGRERGLKSAEVRRKKKHGPGNPRKH